LSDQNSGTRRLREVIQNITPALTIALWTQFILFAALILYFGRDFFVPLSFGVLISFILFPICRWLERRGMSRLTAVISAVIFLLILIIGVVILMLTQAVTFVDEWPNVQQQLTRASNQMAEYLSNGFGISHETQRSMLIKFIEGSGSNIVQMIKGIVSASAFSLVMVAIIPIYAILILYYRRQWMRILGRMFSSVKPNDLRHLVSLTIDTYYNFIRGMAIVYIAVGILNSIGLLFLGVPHAILFGMIASILTFIPYVGIIIGSLLPMAMAWITYDSIWYPVGIVAIFTFVQYLEANVIFPFAVSSRLNVNTLVMLLAIFAGGIIWGVAGMILFVPFVGIAKLIADYHSKYKTLSMILGMPED
jgi:predicted PurR-regulated permease PerM